MIASQNSADPSRAAHYIKAALSNPDLMNAALALHDNRLHEAEPILKAHLKAHPLDVAAIRMLAELAARIGRFKDAENLLRRALELAPEFHAARANLATILYRSNRAVEALEMLEPLSRFEPDNVGHGNLKAAALGRLGDFEEAISVYEQVLQKAPNQPKVWMSYGHILKTVGRTKEGIEAYRKAIDIAPWLGEVWWSLANLKTVKFSESDIAAMQTALKRDDLKPEDRFHLDFALGKAFEDQKDFAVSFGHYQSANALRKQSLEYSADEYTKRVDNYIEFFTPEFFKAREGWGNLSRDPIFIVGMPRAGSTLLEQILSSHPFVEGTTELPDIPNLAGRMVNFPTRLADLSPERVYELGAEYLERAKVLRKTDRPYFIDKLPNNWVYVGFIHLILPNAKIIDARRHPMACGFSNFKQHFAKGQAFSYSLEDMGRYYADYVRLMAHFDRVLKGRVHRVIHEALLDDNEGEIRRLLAACDLNFEPSCLNFYENDRAVRTPSSEQVKKPINRDGADVWQGFAPYLRPLENALGDVLDAYPDVPASLQM